MIQGEADLLAEQGDLQLVPDPIVEVLTHGQGLGSAPKVKPTPQPTRDQLELQKVVVASIVQVDQQTVRLAGPELQLYAGVGGGEPLGELSVGRAGALQAESRNLEKIIIKRSSAD